MAVTVVYFVSYLTLTRCGGLDLGRGEDVVDAPDRETSQQRQGARRAKETVRLLSNNRARAGRRIVVVPIASSGSPSQCTSPLGYAPKGLPFRVSGSVGGDRENRVLGVGRGSGSRGRYTLFAIVEGKP
ncbi:hypothetical protein Taro_036959, partial [Colocasia esculenta]|nr:hypothetical protein [Colocasia esculenta]